MKDVGLNTIAGLEDIAEGALRIGHRLVGEFALKERDLAMLFQSYVLYPHLTVPENMGFTLCLAKVDKGAINAVRSGWPFSNDLPHTSLLWLILAPFNIQPK